MLLAVGPGPNKGTAMTAPHRVGRFSTNRLTEELHRPQDSGGEPDIRGHLERLADARDVDQPTPEMVRERIRRTAMVPEVITVACVEHAAAVGEHCFPTARGVCAERVKRRAACR